MGQEQRQRRAQDTPASTVAQVNTHQFQALTLLMQAEVEDITVKLLAITVVE